MLATAGIIAFSILVVLGIVYFVFRSRVKSTADNEIYNNVYIETVNVSGMKKIRCQKKQWKQRLKNIRSRAFRFA